jgi:alpha-L-arabinofuranosidase
MLTRRILLSLSAVLFALFAGQFAAAQKPTLTVHVEARGKPISPDLFGIFFEDLNYAADGGLYAELVQDRSFEYSPADNKNFAPLTAWELVQRGGQGSVAVESASPLNENNPHYVVLTVTSPGQGVGLRNQGYDGIPLTAGELYDISLFARQLDGPGGPLTVRLESRSGDMLGKAKLPKPTNEWKKYAATLKADRTDADGRLVVLAGGAGKLALDMVSLFPRRSFHSHPNGLRADLAQTIADLRPKFVRFPGGCLVHGDGLANMYRWKNTVGPVEQRKGQPDIWHYHQGVGLGYFEFFQFCEDIGAKPLPVVPAGVCCQNSGASVTGKWGQGQKGLPMNEMPGYVQEVLDLIEYATGPADSSWGAKRAAAGHPRPFGLQYLGIGNEEHITPVFKERFQMVYAAVKARHPEITVIGTVGPFHDGDDYDWGWSIADELKLPMVDEHYYEKPEWFLANLNRYDSYDRGRSKVYLGEYAAHDVKKQPTLRSALAEAAYMTALERNGDVVRMASYAPLLGKLGHTQWDPDLIYFTNTSIHPTINYYVQQLFGRNSGDVYLSAALDGPRPPAELAFSAVRDDKSGDLILKLVNMGSAVRPLHVDLAGAKNLAAEATRTVLTGPPTAVNGSRNRQPLVPRSDTIAAAAGFEYDIPAYSLTVYRFHIKESR